MTDRNVLITLVIIIALFSGAYLFMQWYNKGGFSLLETQRPAPAAINAVFVCSDNKTISADFSDQQVMIKLSDGREYTLEQTISASGARYANEGEAVVFWNKGDTARVEENGQAIFENCVTASGTTVPHEEGSAIPPTNVSVLPASVYDLVAKGFVGKWRNAEVQNQLFSVKEDRSFQESFLTKTGQFMAPEGTWHIEKASNAPETIDAAAPRGALVFVRVSDKGAERRYFIQTISAEKVELTEIENGSLLTWIRVSETEAGVSN